MSVTPEMNMTLPDVNSTPGPTYANEINAALNVVDGHDHTPDHGVQVPTAGVNINADLPFGGHSATGLLAAAFNDQSAHPAGNVRVYFKGGEFYVTDGSGNHVPITAGGSVNVGSVGAITGMGGTSATVSYNNVTKTFTFNQAANQTALMKVGDVVITDSTVTSGSAVTLKAPAGLSSGYTLTAPGALPGSTLPVSMSSAGALSVAQITTAQIADANVTRAKLVAVGQQLSGSLTTSNALAGNQAIAGASVTITTTGRPVFVGFIPDGTSSAAKFGGNVGTAGVDAGFNVKFSSDAGVSFFAVNALDFPVGTSLGWAAPASSVHTIWVTGAGTYTIQAYWIITAGTSCNIANAKLIAYEL